MDSAINRSVLEGFLKCKTKGYLGLAGLAGVKSGYETMVFEAKAKARQDAISRILSRQPNSEVMRGAVFSALAMKRGTPYVLDATLEHEAISVRVDGLMKVDGASKLGSFHYVPMAFVERRKVGREVRLFLEVCGLLLSRVQGKAPSSAVIWSSGQDRGARARLASDHKRPDAILRDLADMIATRESPKLILNDHCQCCEFRQRCRTQAEQEDNISLLRGMGEKEIKRYARKGIFTVTQLAHTFRPRRSGNRTEPRNNRRHHALQALAIRDKKIYVFGRPEPPESPVKIYLDIEGIPDDGYDYLIGMIIDDHGIETRHSFWADDKGQESEIFERLLAETTRHDRMRVFCYGGYEKAFLKRMRKSAKRKTPVDRILDALVNSLSLVYAHFYFPCHSNGLKNVGACLGCTWAESDSSGLQSIVWRRRWETDQDDAWRRKLTAYNMEDCVALKKLTEFIYSVSTLKDSASGLRPDSGDGPQVAWVKDIDRLANDRKWGRVNFFHPDYEYVNNCAYFDYQRDRVYARHSRTLRKSRRKPEGRANRRLRTTKYERILATRCPRCKSAELTTDVEKRSRAATRVKRVFDLIFTPSAIRRTVVEYRSAEHKCLACHTTFVPERYQRLAKHRHGLRSWVIYQHVEHGLSFGTIERMLREFFAIHLGTCEGVMLKALMAEYYHATYQRLLGRILKGNVLHVDETEVKLKTAKGYVWAFTNLEEVVFMYRPTREGEFLRDLLKDFHGVLVSDFYAAYDSIACPQQKCIIHLMRDMNQELLNNPYDEELQSVTRPFGSLLREIVATVDAHGLKRRHLGRHGKAVSGFFESLAARFFRSEAAKSLQERLLKYREKLFTFIQYDGVTWNNNNAENAIKRFAYYRQDTAGVLSEAGLGNFLTMLSISCTCRYKGVSFLKFLLSRERDIDRYCEGKRSGRRASSLDLYPKGFAAPYSGVRKPATSRVPADDPMAAKGG